jgi:AcrR family transcriptional regulator
MSDARRTLLVQVAAAEFASEGYSNASLNRIIDKCGISKSSFYYVIDSKSDLFDFVVRDLIDRVRRSIAIAPSEQFAGPGFWHAVAEFYAQLLLVAQRDQTLLTLGRMFYSGAPERATGPVADTWAAVREWLHGLLRSGRGCGAVREDLPETLQYSLTLSILRTFDEWTITHYEEFAPADLELLADAQFATIRRVLEAR